jgi:hypothetical protein
MKINSSYPYPVLHKDNDNYINSCFKVEYKTYEAFGELKINARFTLDNDEIEDMIKSGDAIYMLHIQCPQTSYRQALKNNNNEINESIETKYLRGKVTLHSFIIAQREIVTYTNHLLNDWYKDMNISFQKGNFIGIGNAIEITLQEDNTELMDLPSIIDIHRAVDQEYMEVDLHSSNIIVSLPKYEYNLYAGFANTRFKSTIISMVILPCLTFVFSKVNENSGDLEEYTWFQVIDKIFKENNYSFEDVGTERLSSLKAAQLILRKPLKTSFKEIEKFNTVED